MSDTPSIKEREKGAKFLYRATSYQDVPKGAILLTQDELLKQIRTKIDRYPNPREIWPLKYDRYVSGGFSALTSAAITHHYRKMFNLKNFGRGPTYACCLMTGLVTSTLHHDFIKEKILLGYRDCPLCITTRGGVVQALSCVGYSMILVPAMCILISRNYYTYPVPSFKERPLVVKMIKSTFPLGTSLGIFLIANFIIGSLLCERELTVYEKFFGHTFDPKPEAKEFFTDLKS